jgi:hypothetical protein
MKALTLTALAALIMAFMMGACGPSSLKMNTLEKFSPCEGKGRTSISRFPKASFGSSSQGSCIYSLDPFDQSAWIEAPLISYKERALQTIVLGCANLVPDAADCLYSGMPGHAATIQLNFNFAKFPANARVQKAVLGVYVDNNARFFTDNAQIRGRYNIGDVFQSLGVNRSSPGYKKEPHAGWVVIDITDFAARAINEQRPSASFEIALPCGRTEQELTTVRLLKTAPVVVVEYK